MLGLCEKKLNPSVVRKNILKLAKYGSAGHIGPSFSLVEILVTLYNKFIKLDWENKNNNQRDILALSKGHGVMALYGIFKEFDWITESDMKNYFSPSNTLKGLSSSQVDRIEVSGGSLGHGLPVSVGIAFSQKKLNYRSKTYCIVGDGELNEGSNWEALMFAAHQKLDNLVVIVDHNKFQAMGTTADVLFLGDLKQKFISFGIETRECDGHNMISIEDSLLKAENFSGKPCALIANTIKGKGVSFMENENAWHYSRLTEEQYIQAFKELENA
ncbi:MAG: transketolase [Spirochaetales bacterium]|nr:transketolase [Spirochaetales bacterium]